MRKLKTREWMLSLATILGTASSTYAQDVTQADALFEVSEPSLVQQIGHDVYAPACDLTFETGCDDIDGGHGYLFGPDEAYDLGDSLFAADSGWDIGGWLQYGYHTANDGVFNTYPDRFQAQQTYFYVEKVADGSDGIGFGGRADIVYGTDGSNTQSFGNHPGTFDFQNGWDHGVYGWAMPQLYAEVAYENLSVKVGHFYTLLGYQVVPATGNFFYSIPYTFNFSEAFTHTGALATYNASDNVTLYGGYTFGWDTGFGQFRNGSSFLGGTSVGVTDEITLTYILTAGNLGWIGKGYTHSIVADYVINEKWEYVFQSDLVSVNDSPNVASATNGHYETIGVNQYLFYSITNNLQAGTRVEWWKANGTSLYEMAYGLNYRPMANLLLRPEVRYNWTPGNDGVPAGGIGPLPVGSPNSTSAADYNDRFVFAMDAIITF